MSSNVAKTIRENLKAAGYNRTKVGVRSPHWGSVCVTIKDRSVDFREVREIAKAEERIHRCEATGEILSGGNTFVEVEIGYDVDDMIEIIEQRIEGLEVDGGGESITLSGLGKLVIFRQYYNLSAHFAAEGEEHGSWLTNGSPLAIVVSLIQKFGPVAIGAILNSEDNAPATAEAPSLADLEVAAANANERTREAQRAVDAAKEALEAARAALEAAEGELGEAIATEIAALRDCIAAKREG